MMYKSAEQKIVMNAFYDELEKLGGVGSTIMKAVPKLTKYLDDAVKFITKGKKTVSGSKGITGSILRHFKKSKKAGKSLGKTLSKGLSKAQSKWGPKNFTNFGKGLKNMSAKGKSQKSFFGWGSSRKPLADATAKNFKSLGQELKSAKGFTGKLKGAKKWAQNIPKHWAGEAASNVNLMKNKGLGNFTKHLINKGRTFKKGGKIYKRSLIGQGLNTSLASPIGFGAGAGFREFKKSGDPLKATGKGLGTTALWGLSPGAAMGTLFGKMGKDMIFKNKKKPEQLRDKIQAREYKPKSPFES